MLIENKNNTELAKRYFFYLYSNSNLRKAIDEQQKMTAKLYHSMHNSINLKVSKAEKFKKLLLTLSNDDDFKTALLDLTDETQRELITFHDCFKYPLVQQLSTPVLLDIHPDKDIAKFILSGNFLHCCRKNVFFDEIAQKYINTDILNRIYTLVCKELL